MKALICVSYVSCCHLGPENMKIHESQSGSIGVMVWFGTHHWNHRSQEIHYHGSRALLISTHPRHGWASHRAVVLIATSQVVCQAFLVKLGMACCWAYTYDIIIMAMTGRHWWLMITDGYKHPENIQEWTSLNEPYTWALIEINIAKMVWFGYAFVISSILGLWTL